MKRLCLIILLVVGCAGAPTYQADPALKQRTVRLASKVVNCVAPGEIYYIHLAQSNDPNAWLDSNKHIYITEGLMKFSNDTILLVVAHELGHDKLGHIYKSMAVSYGITGAMLAANFFVPGIGLLNHAVNPAVTNNYGKTHELDADRFAVESCMRCFGFTVEQSITIFKSLSLEGGGFWDAHPSLDDRIENLKKLNSPNP